MNDMAAGLFSDFKSRRYWNVYFYDLDQLIQIFCGIYGYTCVIRSDI